MKICFKCKKPKKLSEFHQRSDSKDGRSSYCKICREKYRKNWYATNTTAVKQQVRNWQIKNLDLVKQYQETHKKNHREDILKNQRQYAIDNPERGLVNSAKYRAKKRGVPFTITYKDIIIPDVCPVFGVKLIRNTTKGGGDNSPSLDCIISKLGYVPGNIAVISNRANTIKNSGTAEEHRKIAEWMEARK